MSIIDIGKPPHIFQISKDGEPIVTLHSDMRMEFGPNYIPDEAASIFWETILAYQPK